MFRFESFELDLRARELRKSGVSTGLPEQSIRILTLLLERASDVVLREEIRKELWPNDTVVEFDHSINAAMKRLRQALGDSADNPRYIETLARRGYRWKLPVQCEESPLGEFAANAAPVSRSTSEGSLIGKKVSHYRVIAPLGGGGMGVVYRAEDLKLGRPVALKFLPEELANNPAALTRFEREARAASALNHPNICTIYAVEEHDGQPFIAMELLEGHTLRELIADQQRSPENTPQKGSIQFNALLDIGIQVVNGLSAAHSRGIIHRDIKPANIFVTSHGQVKILDFGLAKLQAGVDDAEPPEIEPDLKDDASQLLTLTRTGTTVGTMQYMSPEQVRGEKLDIRTDLFSFGLVLYEMASGQQAFTGETAAVVREAIVSREPTAIHELNRQVPSSLERIINHAIEKDVELRYQSATEMRTDLQKEQETIRRRSHGASKWGRAATASFIVLIVVAAAWMFSRRQPATSHEPNFRQLTINSSENPVTSGAISRNGKYLAYTDSEGIHVKELDTGVIQAISPPTQIDSKRVNWEVISGGWFPDNDRFVVNSHAAEETRSPAPSSVTEIWAFSRAGGQPRRLREHATAYGVSPSGKLIAFGTNFGNFGEREIWLMDQDGEHERRLVATDENHSEEGFYWSPDGQRAVTVSSDESGQTMQTRDLQGGPPIILLRPAETAPITGDFWWLPDGRLVYEVMDSGNTYGSPQSSCNFWTIKLDSSGRPLDKPKPLTHWTGFCYYTSANATADGQKMVFLRAGTQWTVNVADLHNGGTRLSSIRRLTLDESWNFVQDWTSDSKSVFFVSNRSGHFRVYKQLLNGEQPEVISTTEDSFRDTQVTPDGKWLLGVPWPNAPDFKDSKGLVRIPIAGGAPEFVTDTADVGAVFCAKPPSSLCVLGERSVDRTQMIFTSVDPVQGRGHELARFAVNAATQYHDFDVSPDGTHLAVSEGTRGPIHILSLSGQQEWIIPATFNALEELFWAADGKGLYVPDRTSQRTVLIYLDLQGKKHTLLEQRGGGWIFAKPSPDGRHLAIGQSSTSNNFWSMENF